MGFAEKVKASDRTIINGELVDTAALKYHCDPAYKNQVDAMLVESAKLGKLSTIAEGLSLVAKPPTAEVKPLGYRRDEPWFQEKGTHLDPYVFYNPVEFSAKRGEKFEATYEDILLVNIDLTPNAEDKKLVMRRDPWVENTNKKKSMRLLEPEGSVVYWQSARMIIDTLNYASQATCAELKDPSAAPLEFGEMAPRTAETPVRPDWLSTNLEAPENEEPLPLVVFAKYKPDSNQLELGIRLNQVRLAAGAGQENSQYSDEAYQEKLLSTFNRMVDKAKQFAVELQAQKRAPQAATMEIA